MHANHRHIRATKQGLRVHFDRGTLLLEGAATALDGFIWDPRVAAFRAPAYQFGRLSAGLAAAGVTINGLLGRELMMRSSASERRGGGLDGAVADSLRPYQKLALAAWIEAECRGMVALPTGAGKTHVGLAAVARFAGCAAILVPTRVLMYQWEKKLREHFGGRVGLVGDGRKDNAPITIITFASAYHQMDRLGDRFPLVIVDEVHHFGSGVQAEALEMAAAPARLGLSATLPDDPTAVRRLTDLVGPLVFHQTLTDLSGTHLAPFDRIGLFVDLDAEEREAYDAAQQAFSTIYRLFRRTGGHHWAEFVAAASGSARGREALRGFFESRRIVSVARAKIDCVAKLLSRHVEDRCLVFTADNDAAYELSRRALIPAITCDIGRAERQVVLEHLRQGKLRAIVSARVLNEGIDLPDARVGVIVGGSLGNREHIQRIGRLLRPKPGKRAVIYETIARDTHEVGHARKRQLALVT